MNKLLYFFLLITAVLSCSRCKRECFDSTNPDCDNYKDPCLNKSEFTTDFKYYRQITSSFLIDLNYYVWMNQLIRLEANPENFSNKWIVGNDTIIDDDYAFTFGSQWEGIEVPIKLISTGKTYPDCYPNDDGIDTVIHYMKPIQMANSPIFGTFRVADISNPTDSFEVSITWEEAFFMAYFIHATNLFEDGTTCLPANGVDRLSPNSWKAEYIPELACKKLKGDFRVDFNNRFSGVYTYEEDDQVIARNISGRKLN